MSPNQRRRNTVGDAANRQTGPPPDGESHRTIQSAMRTHGPRDGRVTESEFYDVVGNARRRACVRYLLTDAGTVPVSELVSYVLSREDGDADDESHRKSVYSSLRQTHLPMLAEYGIVSFDADANTVAPAESIAAFESAEADVSTPLPGSWPWTYVALGLLAIAWFTAGLFDVISLTDHRFLLISLGYVLLVFLEGLWEVQQLRSALDQVADSG